MWLVLETEELVFFPYFSMALEQMSKADLLRVHERYEDEKDMLQRQRTKKISNSNYTYGYHPRLQPSLKPAQ